MKLLGKLYLAGDGNLYIHSKADGRVYLIAFDGEWMKTSRPFPSKAWRLIGDSYAKD